MSLLKKTFPKILYNKIKTFQLSLPANVKFFNNKYYKFNIKTKKIFSTWRDNAILLKEAKTVYNNYCGGDIIDIGAYVGFYSFLLAPKTKGDEHFLSLEPDTICYGDLLQNLSDLNQCFKTLKFSAIQMPVSNSKLPIYKNLNQDTTPLPSDLTIFHPVFKKRKLDKNISNEKFFFCVQVDEIVKTLKLKPTLIKIDVEGAEFEVLKSMRKTLKIFKPNILLEKHPDFIQNIKDLSSVDSIMTKSGYKAKLINRDKISTREYWTFIK